MSYADFTLSRVVKQFALTLDSHSDLYTSVSPISLRPGFEASLAENSPLAHLVATDKARSEFIISPVLVEAWRMTGKEIGLHSGVEFTVAPEHGLAGACDFIITRSPEQYFVKAPIIVVVGSETEDITRGYGECVAEMLAMQRFNEVEGTPAEKVYGLATDGSQWKFFELERNTIRIDTALYYIKDLGRILGILLHMAVG